jgi:Serine/threonine protein kinase
VSDSQLGYNDIERGERIGGDGTTDLYRATVGTGGGTEIAVREFTVDREGAGRVREGIETWQRLDDHDHVARVLGHGSEPRPWIATEYADGGHLGERTGDLPFAQAVWTALATTGAVRHAHRRGITHLRVEPRDVRFRSVDGGWDAPMVAGWARPVQSGGSGYSAPEQFDPDRYGSAGSVTDVYRLGAVFYELFTGRPPFERHATGIESSRPPPPSAVADVPGALDDVLLTALSVEKADRYDHVLSLQKDLQTLRGSPGGGEQTADGRTRQFERIRSLDNV